MSSSPQSHEHKLAPNVLGLFESAVMGVAGSAPAYSIAASTALLVGAVGLAGPAALLYCGIAMFGIVFAFNYLGRTESNSGATYAWVRRGLHPALGYIAGWSLLMCSSIFMVAATLPAGSSFLGLFSDSLSNNKGWVTLFGTVFFLMMVAAVAFGVTITAKVQVIMSTIEVGLLALFAVLAIFHGQKTHTFSWHWFSPTAFGSSQTFFAGALVAAFYYWGWDVTANLNEETKGSHKTPGQGAIIGMIITFLLFEAFTIGSNMVLSDKDINDNSANILGVLGQKVWPGTPGKLIVVAVLLSTVATLETQLIQVTRTLFSMGRDGTLARSFGKVHKKYKTPVFATMTITVVGIGLFVGSQFIGSLGTIMTDAIASIGVQISIYYALAGYSVVVLFRKMIFKSVKNFIFMGLWPIIGALFMTIMFIKVIPTLDQTTKIISFGTMALGLIPMIWYWSRGHVYFKMPSKEERIAVLQEMEHNL
ncbi:MAG: APC family permease [Actinomycetes bacterium]